MPTKEKWVVGIVGFILLGLSVPLFVDEDLCRQAGYAYKDDAAYLMAKNVFRELGKAPEAEPNTFNNLLKTLRKSMKITSVKELKKLDDDKRLCRLTYELFVPGKQKEQGYIKEVTIEYIAIKREDGIYPTGITVINSRRKQPPEVPILTLLRDIFFLIPYF